MSDTVWLLGAWLAAFVGMGWLALSLDNHWRQVTGQSETRAAHLAPVLRISGAVALTLSLSFCLFADHATMAALVWIMMLAAAALGIAQILSWRAHWLRALLWLTFYRAHR